LCAIHAKRVTSKSNRLIVVVAMLFLFVTIILHYWNPYSFLIVMPKDIQLARRIRGERA